MRAIPVAPGVQIPVLGFGTAGLGHGGAERIVDYALGVGYRHLDTAQIYRSEAGVGLAIRGSGVPRAEIWLTTKVAPSRHRAGDLQRSVEESLGRLGTEPDLLLLHWPNPKVPLRETIGALNEVKRRGLTRHIGVSNFTVALLREAFTLTTEPLLVDQVEYHPYLGQRTLLEGVRACGMALVAYAPLAKGRVVGDPRLRAIGERYGKTAGQVALRWLLQQDGVIAIPRSSREAHVKANLEIFDFELTAAEVAAIGALASPAGRLVDPLRLAPAWDDREGRRPAHRQAIRIGRALAGRIGRYFR